MTAADEAKAQPSQLSDFTFIDEIGHGSFGTVHKVKRKGECHMCRSFLSPLMPPMQRRQARAQQPCAVRLLLQNSQPMGVST